MVRGHMQRLIDLGRYFTRVGLVSHAVIGAIWAAGCSHEPPDFHLPVDAGLQAPALCHVAAVERIKKLHWLSSPSMNRSDTRAVCTLATGETLWIDFNRSLSRTLPADTVGVLFDAEGRVLGYRTVCPVFPLPTDGVETQNE
jgi:hypothetical protein